MFAFETKEEAKEYKSIELILIPPMSQAPSIATRAMKRIFTLGKYVYFKAAMQLTHPILTCNYCIHRRMHGLRYSFLKHLS